MQNEAENKFFQKQRKSHPKKTPKKKFKKTNHKTKFSLLPIFEKKRKYIHNESPPKQFQNKKILKKDPNTCSLRRFQETKFRKKKKQEKWYSAKSLFLKFHNARQNNIPVKNKSSKTNSANNSATIRCRTKCKTKCQHIEYMQIVQKTL